MDRNVYDRIAQGIKPHDAHAIIWDAGHWFCSCQRRFADDNAGFIEMGAHAQTIIFCNGRPHDPDERLRIARLKHALATRIRSTDDPL